MKSENWDAAIDLLYGGALALLRAGQGGSGGDLGIFLVDVLAKSGKGVGAEQRSRTPAVFSSKEDRIGLENGGGGWNAHEQMEVYADLAGL